MNRQRFDRVGTVLALERPDALMHNESGHPEKLARLGFDHQSVTLREQDFNPALWSARPGPPWSRTSVLL
jgi:hypothetical protein